MVKKIVAWLLMFVMLTTSANPIIATAEDTGDFCWSEYWISKTRPIRFSSVFPSLTTAEWLASNDSREKLVFGFFNELCACYSSTFMSYLLLEALTSSTVYVAQNDNESNRIDITFFHPTIEIYIAYYPLKQTYFLTTIGGNFSRTISDDLMRTSHKTYFEVDCLGVLSKIGIDLNTAKAIHTQMSSARFMIQYPRLKSLTSTAWSWEPVSAWIGNSPQASDLRTEVVAHIYGELLYQEKYGAGQNIRSSHLKDAIYSGNVYVALIDETSDHLIVSFEGQNSSCLAVFYPNSRNLLLFSTENGSWYVPSMNTPYHYHYEIERSNLTALINFYNDANGW